MAQLILSLDEETIRNIVSAASRENRSISEWVGIRLAGHMPVARSARGFRAPGPLAETELWAVPSAIPVLDD
jgi:hypothetical protein